MGIQLFILDTSMLVGDKPGVDSGPAIVNKHEEKEGAKTETETKTETEGEANKTQVTRSSRAYHLVLVVQLLVVDAGER